MWYGAPGKLERLMEWQAGKTPGPWTISLYPTYRCNIQCKICWKRAIPEPLKPNEEIRDERMLSLVDEAADLGVREWIVGGGGELMLRNKIVIDMFEKIRARGMNGTIQTNATKFKEEELERIVEMGWAHFNVSLDGPTAEINDANRIERNFDRAIETIKRLQAIKKAKNSPWPQINIISVVTNVTYQHLKGMVELSKELDLSPGCLSAVDLIVYGENDKAYELNEEQRAAMPGLVREAIDHAEQLGVVCNYRAYLGGLNDGAMLDAMGLFSEPDTKVSSKTMCFEPFSHMVIMPQGDSGPCCTFEEENCQNIWNAPLKEVWMGEYMQQVRKQILSGQAPDYCKECMITRIQDNKDIQEEVFHLEEIRTDLEAPLTLPLIFGKASSSLKRHGVGGSIRRGREWLYLRRQSRK